MTTAYRNIARVVAPHGIKGEVSVEALRGLPFLLYEKMVVSLTPPAIGRDRFCTVERVDAGSGLVRFSGIGNLDEAEGISGCFVLAREEDLDLGMLDVAYDELIGRDVVDGRYGYLGTISEVMETPANDVWVVEGRYGEVLIPVIESVVAKIPEIGSIRVRLMDGLIEGEPLANEGDRQCS